MLQYFRTIVLVIAGALAGIISSLFGGFDMLMQSLVVFMAIDILSGTMAAVFFKCLSSRASLRGIVKKAATLFIIIIAVHLDALLGTNDLTRNAAIIALILNELLSIIENLGRMGVKMPPAVVNALEILQKK